MKRRSIIFLLILCVSMLALVACAGVGPNDSVLGHRFGNPEITFANGEVYITYPCVDCDYYEMEVRTGSTQVTDGTAWDAAFENIDLTGYSAVFRINDGENTVIDRYIVAENRGYHGEFADGEPDALAEKYTLQKNDGTYVTYIRENGQTTVASETGDTNSGTFDDIIRDSKVYLSCAGKFDQFTYDSESGSYISIEPVKVSLRDASGASLGEKLMENVSVSIGDGQVISIKADYSQINELLEEVQVNLCFYNIGYSVVKVPQSFIEAVTGDTAEPNIFAYEIYDGKATITGVNTSIGGEVTIPAVLGDCPVVAIGEIAFKDCMDITTVVIPDSVTTIGDNAFLRCAGLANVHYAGTQAQWEAIAIGQIGNEALLNASIQFRGSCEHSYDDGTVTKAPTCGAEGIKTYTCTICGDTKVGYLARLPYHSYDDGVVTEESTCNEAGIKVYTCAECGKNKTEYIPKLAVHTYTNGTCIHCGADDPHYADNTDQSEPMEIGGIVGAILRLIQAVIDVFSFF